MKQAVIIGDGVSKGARSPVLWNACFSHFGIDGEMIAIDVNSDDELKSFFSEFLPKKDFIGGAVAAPLKQHVTDYFNELQNSNFDMPTNCFFRKSENSNFNCLNTDVLAAVNSIESKIDLEKVQSMAILGDGSVGLSIGNYFRDHNFKKAIYSRSPAKNSIRGFETLSYKDLSSNFNSYELVINCTSVGKDGSDNESIISRDLLNANASNNLFIYDVNYINSPNQLLRFCKELDIKHEDGSKMNIMQAVIAFSKALDMDNSSDEILDVMKNAVLNS